MDLVLEHILNFEIGNLSHISSCSMSIVFWNMVQLFGTHNILYISIASKELKNLKFANFKLHIDLLDTYCLRRHLNMLPLELEYRRKMMDLRYLYNICNGAGDSTCILGMLNFSVPSVYKCSLLYFISYPQMLHKCIL